MRPRQSTGLTHLSRSAEYSEPKESPSPAALADIGATYELGPACADNTDEQSPNCLLARRRERAHEDQIDVYFLGHFQDEPAGVFEAPLDIGNFEDGFGGEVVAVDM